tara:strand:+ start:445 stop:717 length:273 start_codon:yes stop_codon:yes gene_type:complete
MIKKKENPSASLLELLANKLVARTIGRRNKIELIDLFDRFIMVIPYVNNDFLCTVLLPDLRWRFYNTEIPALINNLFSEGWSFKSILGES